MRRTRGEQVPLCCVSEIGFGREIGVAATLTSSDKLAWAEPCDLA